MRKYLLLFLPFIIACNSGSNKDKQVMEQADDLGLTTYYFIRHAEKDTSDPDNRDPELAEEGVVRAKKWAEVFKEVDFDLIYSSNYKRTRATAEAVAGSQQKEVTIYDASKLNDEDFQKNTPGKTVLVVGHSNTNPKFVNYLLEEEKYKDIEDTESGSLFIVTVAPNGRKTSQVLYIN
ncbi:histidine phosphatase family protein [Antarcticibacterium flavum]|uniref:Histidine phosphatase family protein n=1 Tax=Antarcticibacterium flavum TaxID=2058175 RepID=A0A5B7X626_9FLAO|nr:MULTISPECIES: phosphoglycerate mutase family protein [Antarcticibacterium]MCM4159610.1 phosphoglycerate mutase [Antarcticibacterium sp. W02-3]QCY70857.1 histidine phosphatase family protein [Antarcticibacterium flavum]